MLVGVLFGPFMWLIELFDIYITTVVCPYCFKSFKKNLTQCPYCKSYFKRDKNNEFFKLQELSEVLNPRTIIRKDEKRPKKKKPSRKGEKDQDLKIIY